MPKSKADKAASLNNMPLIAMIKLIGGKYKPLILWRLMTGTKRYSTLRREIPCATPKMLTQQLRELETDGLIKRTVYPVVPPKVEYALTPQGETIIPVLQTMYSWGQEYLQQNNPIQD